MDLLEIPVVLTGRAILKALSLNKLSCQSMTSREHLVLSPAGALFYTGTGKFIVTVTGQAVTGFLFYIVAGLVAYFVLVP